MSLPLWLTIPVLATACADKAALDSGTCKTIDGTYIDADGDGFGSELVPATACDEGVGQSSIAGDCDDNQSDVYPGAVENCDGVDQDCDGVVDDDAVDAILVYTDADGDGYGDPDSAVLSCALESGQVDNGSDCDDLDASVHPGAVEVVSDGVDQDCDGADGGDQDGDGFFDESLGGDDCDDSDATVHPGAEDVCADGVDQDCDGLPPGCRAEGRISSATAALTLWGATPDDDAGWSVAGGQDLTGDGRVDLVVGSPGLDGSGTDAGGAYVWAGPMSGTRSLMDAHARMQGDETNLSAGVAVAVGPAPVEGGGARLLVGGRCFGCLGAVTGTVWLFEGPLTGELSLDDAILRVVGEAPNDYFGAQLSASGDVDGDGVGDWLVGGDWYDNGQNRTGAAYVLSGATEGTIGAADSMARIYGTVLDGGLGHCVAGLGDTDGDGIDDVLVGGMQADFNPKFLAAGAVYLYLGPVSGQLLDRDADSTVQGEAESFGLGWQCGAAGDHNGDGTADFYASAVGDSEGGQSAGAMFLFTDKAGFLSSTDFNAKLIGNGASDHLGKGSLQGTQPDFDGDGFLDLIANDHADIIGHDDVHGEATTYVAWGPLTGTVAAVDAGPVYISERPGEGMGYAAAAVGDVDGDSYEDFIVGALDAADPEPLGAVYLFRGGGW